MKTINFLIADTQFITCNGIICLLNELRIATAVQTVFNKDDLFDAVRINHYDVLIIDHDLLDFNNLDELAEVKVISPDTTIVIFTDDIDSRRIKKIIEIGIANYVLKSSEKAELEAAITAAVNKKKYFSQQIIDILVSKSFKHGNTYDSVHLTDSELEIIKLISQGGTTKEIAAKKSLSIHTIATHRKNIFRKLSINNSSELIKYAINNGIIDEIDYYI